MSVEVTYLKKVDGKVYQRQIETREDVNGIEFITRDVEKEFLHERILPDIEKEIARLQQEIVDRQEEEVDAARRLGIRSVHVTRPADVTEVLKSFG